MAGENISVAWGEPLMDAWCTGTWDMPHDQETPNMPPSPSAMGSRYNTDKPRYDLIPPGTLDALERVSRFGAKKYSDRNWEKGMSYETLYRSLMNHLQAWWKGRDTDEESNLPTSWHLLWNAMAIVEMERRLAVQDQRLSPLEIDNRPYKV